MTANTANIESQIKVIPDNTGETELGPGDTGYFDIEINPAGTEVSVEYTININANGELNEKYPGGAAQQKNLLEAEGHTIIQRGRTNIRYYVKDYENALYDLK